MKHLTETSTEKSELSIDNDGIVNLRFREKNQELTLVDVEEILEARLRLATKGRKQMLLVDIRNNPRPNRSVRSRGNDERVNDITLGIALLVDGPISRLIGNFFMGFNQSNFPIKVFSDRDEAAKWLMKMNGQ